MTCPRPVMSSPHFDAALGADRIHGRAEFRKLQHLPSTLQPRQHPPSSQVTIVCLTAPRRTPLLSRLSLAS